MQKKSLVFLYILTISTYTSSSVGSGLPIPRNVFPPQEEAHEKLSWKPASC